MLSPFADLFRITQAYELSVLTGTQVLLLVVSETGLVYTFTTPKLQPLVTKPEGKNLIQVRPSGLHIGPLHPNLCCQACLNAPEPADANGADGESVVESPEDTHSSVPPPTAGMQSRGAPMPPNAYNMAQDHQAMQYQAYLQQQHAAQQGAYPMSAASMAGRQQ